MKKENPDSDFDNSPEKYEKCNRHIMTFEQIVKSASERQLE